MTGTWALNLFDRLHTGHHVLIDILSEMPNPVAAVTAGELIGEGLELGTIIQPLEHRVSELEKYLKDNQLDIKTEALTTFDDLLTIEDQTTFMMFEGPCCVEIEKKGLEYRQRELGVTDTFEHLKPVRAHDGDKLSSARVRLGEIDRTGRRLKGTNQPPRILPQTGREVLAAPKGEVFDKKEGPPERRVVARFEKEEPSTVIAVGDVTSWTLMKEGFVPDVSIVDGITKRGPFEEDIKAEREYRVYNPAAVLYPEAWSAIGTAISDGMKSLVYVEGEEDLMGFPAVLLAEKGSVVLYGQPNVGIIWVPVNSENKDLANSLLEAMPVIT
jgi:uncharacterized protein (UPF0218 family)/phosphopantetheine adenylyltransferase